jgi:hypothetical protein
MSYDRQLEDKTRLTVDGKRLRVGNKEHPYHDMYKKHGIDAVVTAMGLLETKAELEEQEFPWSSVVFGIAILWAVVCLTTFGD